MNRSGMLMMDDRCLIRSWFGGLVMVSAMLLSVASSGLSITEAADESSKNAADVTGGNDSAATEPTDDVEQERAKLKFFETRIRPLLAERCFKCHGPEKQQGGLRLDARANVFAGGESGPSIVPGKPDESLLIGAIRYESFEMPPSGKLPDEEVELLTAWVKAGAYWPESDDEVRKPVAGGRKITDEDRQWWAFQPVRRPEIPSNDAAGWARSDIDRFIAQKLDQHELRPAPEADRRTLIRRAYFDLIGLPPNAQDIAAFENDASDRAFENVIDRLLDSPQYGERWGRMWLDLVRYSESDGYRKDDYRPTLWRYRDYVIRSFNDFKPIDRFMAEQIAGDELDPDNPEAVVATGYWRLYLYEYNQRDVRTHWQAIVEELTDVTGDVYLGMSMGCAKCHDHKFDPILREDYYRLQAYFGSILPRDADPLGTPDEREQYRVKQAEWEARTKEIRDQIAEIEAPYRAGKRRSAVEKFPPDVRDIALKPESDWDVLECQLMDLVQRQVDLEYDQIKLKDEDQRRVEELQTQLKEFDELKPLPLPVALTVRDALPVPGITFIPGDRQKRDISPGRLSVLNPEPAEITPPESGHASTGRRLALARWITDPTNPLTPRVFVNRVWQQHFGSGLVESSGDFGHLGEQPSHPELLDHLTSLFLDSGWQIRDLHKAIMLSATYRQSAFHPDELSDRRPSMVDPRNRLRWRWDVRRLDSEQIRDAMLAASGELDLKAGGEGVSADQPRRSVYTRQMRNAPDAFLSAFDAADMFNSTSRRDVTTTPTQSLLTINGEWVLKRAAAFAKEVDRAVGRSTSPGRDVHREIARAAWLRAFGREPDDGEQSQATAFLEQVLATAEPVVPTVEQFAGTSSPAASVRDSNSKVQWATAKADGLPTGDFTIEAFILLDSVYPDASVRTIASQWNGRNDHRGWNFGVTSEKSAYQPRNLILQLIGGEPGGSGTAKPKYEVIASNLRPELGRPYYAAVSISMQDTSEAGITFYLKDLSTPDAPLQTATVKHTVVGDYHSDLRFVLGDRDAAGKSRWNGLLDDVRLSAAALQADELLINGGAGRDVVGFWRFDDDQQPGSDVSPSARSLVLSNQPEATQTGVPLGALTDLAHVLLNSSELLYVD